jgi:hypothetical protein
MEKEKLLVCVTEYFMSHGKTPKGRGSWAFYFDSQEAVWWAKDERGWMSMNYSEAVKLAKTEARKRNAHVISVAP